MLHSMTDSQQPEKPADESPYIAKARLRQKRHKRYWLFALLLLMLTGVPFASWLALPTIQRYRYLEMTLSSDATTREWGLAYIVEFGPEDEKIVDGVVARFSRAGDQQALELAGALRRIGQWERSRVGDQAWLRWIKAQTGSDESAKRMNAALQLQQHPAFILQPGVVELLTELAEDEDPAVQQQAGLAVAASVLQVEDESRKKLIQALRDLTQAQAPTATQAWMTLGWLGRATGNLPEISPDGEITPTDLARTWAVTRSAHLAGKPSPLQLEDASLHPQLRAIAAMTSGQTESPGNSTAGSPSNPGVLQLITADQQPLAVRWAVACFMLKPTDEAKASLADWLTQQPTTALDDPAQRWLILAVIHALPDAYEQACTRTQDWLATRSRPDIALARVESAQLHTIAAKDIDTRDPYLHLASLTRADRLTHENFISLFSSRVSSIRDQAVLIALERLPRDEQRKLIDMGLDSLNEPMLISTAMLLAMMGDDVANIHGDQTEIDALVEKLKHREAITLPREQSTQKLMLQVALWVRGDQLKKPAAVDLVGHAQLPNTTIWLAMLHRGEPDALAGLLNPSGSPPTIPLDSLDPQAANQQRIDLAQGNLQKLIGEQQPIPTGLHELLIDYRWQNVLMRYLPEDQPPVNFWADTWLQQFQIDLLRHWALMQSELEPEYRPMFAQPIK